MRISFDDFLHVELQGTENRIIDYGQMTELVRRGFRTTYITAIQIEPVHVFTSLGRRASTNDCRGRKQSPCKLEIPDDSHPSRAGRKSRNLYRSPHS